MTVFGVPLGAKMPNHEPASNPGKPFSATAGTSGSERERLALVTASARSLPAWMCEITDGIVANMNWMRPDSRSFSASAPLYGTCVAGAPMRSDSMKPDRCDEVPTPVEP
ncbi:hypothetical protein D3C71_1895130 [compost metagenome]